ncbi:class I SAM-dependent methyltransferase [Quadrisphaera granulorum]|nr:class I SAM-dependent methyltransferase [Quadrisphaera granulorum]
MAAPAVMSTALKTLDRVNTRHPWSHGEVYAPLVLHHARRVVAAGGTCAVDVGCGTGRLLERLASVVPQVIGIEPHAQSAALATHATGDLPHVTVRHAPFGPLPEGSADLVTFISSLHHLPLEPTLEAVRSALRPGGRLVVIGCYRDTPADRLHSWASVVLNPVIGLVKQPRAASSPPPHMRAPTRQPQESFEEVATTMRRTLPGVSIHRGLFWRYVAVWVAPR